jgi:hypothetical protein
MTTALSPWAATIKKTFRDQELQPIYEKQIGQYVIRIHNLNNSFWIAIGTPAGAQIVLRPAYAPDDQFELGKVTQKENNVTFNLSANIGRYRVRVEFPDQEKPLIRYTTTFTASDPLLIPFWPRDLVLTGTGENQEEITGTVLVSQQGTRSGLQYFTIDKPQAGAALYFQNLTALNTYAQFTETSLGGVVGGTWPEIGFALPPTLKGKPLIAHQEIVLSDAFLAFDPIHAKDEMEQAKQFLELLADIYLHLPKPATTYQNWPDILAKGLKDLEFSHGCWSHAAGQDYLNAYVADYMTPPELMVQLAVLLPLTDYHDWCDEDVPAIMKIKMGLDAFYSKDLKTVVRFLPSLAKDLSGDEEQLKPNVMDSWYLHHPLLNLGRLALRGDKQANKLFLESIDFTVKVARHFNYEWPVMYDMETLEVVKAETQPGKGGEKDVAGLYAFVMLHAWQLTKNKTYLNEAKKAAKTLQGKGFQLFYQANNTAFSANAMLWLYKETKEKVYLDLAYLCIANIVQNFQLWECEYGFAKDYPTFFATFPLGDAPYTAAYEEQEVFAALHNFLLYADGEEILPAVSMLIPEFLKYILNRAAYYYPPNLPAEMLSREVKTGQVDHKLWIAIEDIHDGWEQSGTVGQEVYGAGVAFGIVPRHFYKVPNEDFMIYCDYPSSDYKHRKGNVTFNIKGDGRFNCRVLIVKKDKKTLPQFTVKDTSGCLKGTQLEQGHIEYTLSGNQHIRIQWS